jgi:hypothetical protein
VGLPTLLLPDDTVLLLLLLLLWASQTGLPQLHCIGFRRHRCGGRKHCYDQLEIG